MRVFGTDAGAYYAGEREELVIGHILTERGERALAGFYEVHPEMARLLEVPGGRTFPQEIARIAAEGGKFPRCIASEG